MKGIECKTQNNAAAASTSCLPTPCIFHTVLVLLFKKKINTRRHIGMEKGLEKGKQVKGMGGFCRRTDWSSSLGLF